MPMCFLDRSTVILLDMNGTFMFGEPSPVLFDLAFQTFGVRKEDVVFVGDSLVNDIEGAKGFGISAVWINRDGHHSTCADHVVSDLGDLVAQTRKGAVIPCPE